MEGQFSFRGRVVPIARDLFAFEGKDKLGVRDQNRVRFRWVRETVARRFLVGEPAPRVTVRSEGGGRAQCARMVEVLLRFWVDS